MPKSLTRHVIKPFLKRVKTSPSLAWIEHGYRKWTGCRCGGGGLYLPMVLVVVVTLAMLSVDTIRSSNTIVFSIGSPGQQPVYLNGIYKTAIERPDGSIDVVFNIPQGAQVLLQANLSGTGLDLEAFNLTELEGGVTSTSSPVAAPTPPPTKSLYPSTLDGDYVINPAHLCPRDATLDYVILVHSATAYFQRRRVIRETFAAKKLFGSLAHRLVFLLGETQDPHTTKALRLEALAHGDLLQGAFTDSYHNLTLKGVMGLRWMAEHCPNVRLVVKMDDDVFMNPFQFVRDYLPLYRDRARTIACHVRARGTSLIVRGKGKWQVKPEEFQGYDYFPFDHCNGYFVIMTPDLLQPLVRAARMNPFFWIDDVYLYGILPATIGNVAHHNIHINLTTVFERGRMCYAKRGRQCTFLAVSQWRDTEQTTLWRMVLNTLTKQDRQDVGLFQLPYQ